MTVENWVPFNQPFLSQNGLDGTKMSNQTQDITVPDSHNLTIGSGTYEVEAKNKQPDTIELSNQHDIFAQLNTESNDKVKLDGTGWVRVQVPPSPEDNTPGGHMVFINKNTNSAVTVNGGATVTDDQGNTIPTQLQPARATRLFSPKTNPADASLVLTTDGNYEKVAGGSAKDHNISLEKAKAACQDPKNSQELRDALYWLTTGGHFEQVAGGPNKDISLQQLQDFYNQNKPH